MESSSLTLMKGASAPTAKQLPVQACQQAQIIPQRATAMSAIFNRRKLKRGKVVMKAMEKVGGVVEEVEREMEEEGWWGWREMEKCRGGCEDPRGMVELMECLEREAIMGEDEGKHPSDYNRRAHIFHTSSKLFQALNQTQPSA